MGIRILRLDERRWVNLDNVFSIEFEPEAKQGQASLAFRLVTGTEIAVHGEQADKIRKSLNSNPDEIEKTGTNSKP